MFEIPNAKRVRRDELYDSSSEAGNNGQGDATRQDDAEDQEVRAKLNERLSHLLGLDLSGSEPAAVGQQPQSAAPADIPIQDNTEEHEDKQEEEFEFRLFSTSAKAAAPTKVILAASDDEDADLGEGAFTVPERPLEYYLVGEPTLEELERYRYSAVAGEDIVLGARKRAWGLERPWRVVKVTASAKAGKRVVAKSSSDPKSKDESEQGPKENRKRPGKKRRIAMRIKTKAEKEKREVEEKSKVSKEEHLAEKKKRLNRERKLKRRAKEREKKMATKGEVGTQQALAGAADSGSDSGSD